MSHERQIPGVPHISINTLPMTKAVILQVHPASPMALAFKAHSLAPSVSVCVGQLQYGTSKMELAQAAGASGLQMRAARCRAPSQDAAVTEQPARRVY